MCVKCVGESGQKWDSGRVKPKVPASPQGEEPRATSRPGGNVIAGAVRAVMESLSVAVHI